MVGGGVTADPYYFKYQVTTLFARKHFPIYPAFEAATEAVPRLLAPKSLDISLAVCLLGQPRPQINFDPKKVYFKGKNL